MIRVSTGFKHGLLNGTAWADLFPDACIRVYSGALPLLADDPPTGTLLANITRDGLSAVPGHGFTWLLSSSGFVTRGLGEDWALKGVAGGTALYARLAAITDPPIFSSSSPRIDFEVNPIDGNGFLLTDPEITATLSRDVPYFLYGIPPLTF